MCAANIQTYEPGKTVKVSKALDCIEARPLFKKDLSMNESQ